MTNYTGYTTSSTTTTNPYITTSNITTGTFTQTQIYNQLAQQARIYNPVPLLKEKRKQPKPKITDRIRDAFAKLAAGGPMKDSNADAIAKLEKRGIPLIAGAAPEAEVKKTVEVVEPKSGKKKITLERTVPMRREKQGKMQDIHRGKVHLVRTTDGPEHLTRSVGIKVEPLDGSGHVEIPLKDLREALDELEEA